MACLMKNMNYLYIYENAYAMAQELLDSKNLRNDGGIIITQEVHKYQLTLKKDRWNKNCLVIESIGYAPAVFGGVDISEIPKGSAAEIWNDLYRICKERNLDLHVESVLSEEFGNSLIRKGFYNVPGGGKYILEHKNM